MPALDATVGGPSSNSYLTLEQALSIAEIVLDEVALKAFLNQATTEREVCLMRATRMLERSFEWQGYKVDDDQSLGWPRYYHTLSGIVYESDNQVYGRDVIPRDVQDATILLAAHVAAGFSTSDSLGAPVTNIKLGPISVAFDEKKGKTKTTIPEDVISAVSKLGDYTGVTSGGRAITLERS